MSGHTPGPWYVADGCSWRRILQVGTDTEVIVPTNSITDGHPDLTAEPGKREANLTLAAAAPDLLEALSNDTLNKLMGMVEDSADDEMWSLARLWMEQRDAAIRKAKGGAS